MNSTLDVIKEILDEQMNMPAGRVFAYNSNVDLPQDSELFIPLYYAERRPTANNSRMVPTATGVEEHQSINMVEDVIIALISRDTSARDRVQEVFLALNSYVSRNLQAKNKLHISWIGEAYDKSFLEATSMLNRFDIKIRIFRSYEKINSIDYYDTFSFEVWAGLQNDEVKKDSFEYSMST